MGTLADLLTQNRPDVDTGKALLILDLQNDFSENGKLPVTYAAGLANLGPLCDAFRTERNHVVWLRTDFSQLQQYDGEGTAGDDQVIVWPSDDNGQAGTGEQEAEDSEEEFLRSMPPSRSAALLKRVAERNKAARKSSSPPRDLFLSNPTQNSLQRCCQHGSQGADFVPSAAQLIDPKHDMVVFKNTYSAFSSTNLLFQLQARLVTELFICGSFTNVSVYATAASAVQHGMQVTILQDCLGYVDRQAHDEALKRMHEFMGATMSSSTVFVRHSKPGTLRNKRSAVLPRISVNDLRASPSAVSDGSRSPAAAPSPLSASVKAKTKLPQRSPEGSRVPSSTRSESRSSHNSPTSTRIPLVRSESRSSTTSDPPQLSRRTSSLAIRQKPTSITETLAEATVVRSERSISQHSYRELPSPRGDEGTQTTTKQSYAAVGAQVQPESTPRQESSHAKIPSQNPIASLHRPSAAFSVGLGDSMILKRSLDEFLDPSTFVQLKREVYWQRMFHVAGEVPRLVCAQGTIDPQNGTMPVYRHPADQALPLLQFSPTIERIRRRIETEVGHPINHCLAQLYRSGQDFISEHSDKTLDIVRGSWIINASLGAQRTMRLRSKRAPRQDISGEPAARQSQSIPLPHGSVFLLGPEDNATYLHGIQANKRPASEKSEVEQAFGGERISLTFRYIGTFLDAGSERIWGQGATGKTLAQAARVVNGDEGETARMVKAFGTENQTGRDFDWEDVYGGGFDVLHFHARQQGSAEDDDNVPILFRTQSADIALPVELFLRHHGLPFRTLSPPPSVVFTDAGAVPDMMLRDADTAKTQVIGLEAILLYLDRFYGAGVRSRVPNVKAQRLVLNLARMTALSTRRFLTEMESVLRGHGDAGAAAAAHLGGNEFSIADCAYWALVEDAVDEHAAECAQVWPGVYNYHNRLSESLGRVSSEAQWHDAEEHW